VAAYYVVAEALTNVAKHASASVVQVEVDADDGLVRLAIQDDGVGDADPTRGSGLIGLKDRVEATSGTLASGHFAYRPAGGAGLGLAAGRDGRWRRCRMPSAPGNSCHRLDRANRRSQERP
jgi:nitrate/nitrite-specific signal transduction histidine kinase